MCFYLIAQMVGAGQLIKLLFGLDYAVAVVAVGALMMVYVIFGGMIATTWVQIIKAGMLLAGGTLVMLLAHEPLRVLVRDAGRARDRRSTSSGSKLMAPGPLLADPVNAISLGARAHVRDGRPAAHPDALLHGREREGGPQVACSTRPGFVGYFFNVIFLMGLSAILIVGQDPTFFEGGVVGGKLIGGGNMVAMHLAKAVGGNFLLGFLAAVAFATILAVVSGLALAGASAISHDLYARVIKKGQATEAGEMRVSKIATIGLGVVAIGSASSSRSRTSRSWSASRSASPPRRTSRCSSSRCTGRASPPAARSWAATAASSRAVMFVLLSKSVWVSVLGNAAAIFPYDQPALFAMPLAFLVTIVVSKLDRQRARRGGERGVRGPVRPRADGRGGARGRGALRSTSSDRTERSHRRAGALVAGTAVSGAR